MKFLKVNLWGKEIGRLVWEPAARRTYFVYNPHPSGEIPDIAPLFSPEASRKSHLPVYGDQRPIYQGLPPFIADSLPDSWGNTLFDKWVKDNRIPRNKISPLYKLMFIGTRGMGALEYEPCAADLNHTRAVDIKSLYDMSLKILEDRNDIVLDSNDELTMQALLAVGTSAGGRQMKAIIAINETTGEIRSGQTDGLEEFEYYILKFGNESMPTAEIEAAYYKMAAAAGIEMEECRLMPVAGTNHFLTKRFDRKDGKKIHMQTLAAINPEANSYEDLIATCRELSLSESEIEQLFTRLVFNIISNNTDDHNKNFSFLLEENGRWRLAPAYDVTFIFNTNATGPNTDRKFSVGGKTSDISLSELLDFAKQNDIRNAAAIISRVTSAVTRFDEYTESCNIRQPWRGIIRKTLYDKLVSFGAIDTDQKTDTVLHDRFGRTVDGFAVTVNSSSLYEVSAAINGTRRKRFVRPSMSLYKDFTAMDIFNLSDTDKLRLAEMLFPD